MAESEECAWVFAQTELPVLARAWTQASTQYGGRRGFAEMTMLLLLCAVADAEAAFVRGACPNLLCSSDTFFARKSTFNAMASHRFSVTLSNVARASLVSLKFDWA